MSQFFIHRPVFAAVISIIIVIAGLMASQVLPISQYPEIAPPTVTITASYPGASAETLAKTVAAPIEEQLSGVEHLIYFNSSSSSTGSLNITATFDVGADVGQAVIDINNRVAVAEPRLPEDVRRSGIVVRKRSNDILLFVALRSPDSRYDTLFLSNYATFNILDVFKRLPGVADSTVFGARDYSMRIWLKPDRMAQLGVTSTDIADAIRAQNAQYAAGKIGQEPAPEGQSVVYTVTARGRLVEPEEFGNIIVRASGPNGVLRIKDVARVELGAQNYDTFTLLDGKPTVGVAVYLQSGANALEVANEVRDTIVELATKFPEGVEYVIPFDTTRFVQASIDEVLHTLLIAAVLVVFVVFVFLQSWRATLIPVIAVPVSLIGTFAGLYVFGFSINTLTLFAMVLAIGIVVDDAIVVLENVERLMAERQLSPLAAAIEAMHEVSGAVIAIVLALCAVFVPVAFLGGLAGKLYQQFAVTVAIAVVISGVVALTLTPALCALLLKPSHQKSAVFKPFNRGFAQLTRLYSYIVGLLLRHAVIAVLLFLCTIAAGVWMFKQVPGSFVPLEDQGYVFTSVSLPDGASIQRTHQVVLQAHKIISEQDAVEHMFGIEGFDLLGGGNKTNAATAFLSLKPWDERTIGSDTLIKTLSAQLATLRDGIVFAINPPPIRGLGSAGGFEVYLQDRSGGTPHDLYVTIRKFIGELGKRPELTGLNSFFRPTVPQLFVEVDQEQAVARGVPVDTVFDALQSTTGSLYVNDFNKNGRTFRVQLQAEQQYRARPEDLDQIYVRSNSGAMIPLPVLVRIQNIVGPEQIERYNGFAAAKIIGSAAPGTSSGGAIAAVEEVAKTALPEGYTIAWTGQAFQEKRAGTASAVAFQFAIVMVFLILAAQYEKWTLPVAVLLAVPFALVGALLAVLLRGMNNDIYFQIGLVVLIGLAAKNAILIVEFAAQNQAKGMTPVAAALEAARLRFRPIIMTSLAFVLGVLPLVLATGAGAAARQSMGTGVFGGMLAATFIATLFVPTFFALLARRSQPAAAVTDSRKPEP